jgi:regulator of cell morphogenesis and NO signaling
MTLERLTVAEIAGSSLAAVRVLEEHGIDYCADPDRSLAEVCADRDLDLPAIVAELSSAPPGDAEDLDWTSEPIGSLLDYLASDDHAYFRSELRVLERRLALAIEHHGDAQPQLYHLRKVFLTLREDLETHMGHEEKEVFPAIDRYLQAGESGEAHRGSPLSPFGGPLRLMELEHETAGASLRLMRDFAQNYEMATEGCPRLQALLAGLLEFEDRLLRHMYIENNILLPRCAALKAQRPSPVAG